MKEKILEFRNDGHSYNEICRKLGCSKSLVAYYCGVNQKEKSRKRKEKYRKGNYIPKAKIEKNCLSCGVIINSPRSTAKFCSNKCSSDKRHNDYIQKWKNNEISVMGNDGRLSNYIRTYLFKKYDGKCSRCGWSTPNPFTKSVILEVEHIDGDSTNNKEENLDLVCPNCHSLTSTYKALNSGKGNRNRLKYNKLI